MFCTAKRPIVFSFQKSKWIDIKHIWKKEDYAGVYHWVDESYVSLTMCTVQRNAQNENALCYYIDDFKNK